MPNLGQQAFRQNPDDKDLGDEKLLNPQKPRRAENTEMERKGKNPNTPKKAAKPKVVQKLIDEDSDYEDKEPLLRCKRKKSSPKAPPAPKPIEVQNNDDTKTTTPAESESSEQEGSKQNESEQPEIKKDESEELEAGHVEFDKYNFEEPFFETPSAENQVEKEPPAKGTLIKCKNSEVRENAR
ncbi:uncharacterized protein LOC124898587 [Capsicum annuum]|uniref:uncharacterized protein LOC124898587 n=1 Tax=Capsicum annuum TaxID=4072 RepID=UPI001FB111B3|nr:uncharacterized protein LOC124898587 [Capsicum annuum]